MNEEELFCKLFPEYVVHGKPLSPYFDLFERGYEEAENRAEELEKSCNETQKLLDKQIEATYKLDKENAELKANIAFCEKACEGATMMYEHLIKAKELLKEFIFLLHNPRTALDTKTVMDKAEQFLKK